MAEESFSRETIAYACHPDARLRAEEPVLCILTGISAHVPRFHLRFLVGAGLRPARTYASFWTPCTRGRPESLTRATAFFIPHPSALIPSLDFPPFPSQIDSSPWRAMHGNARYEENANHITAHNWAA